MKLATKIVAASAATLGAAAASEWVISNNALTVDSIAIRSKKIPHSFDGFRIVHISDMHCASFGQGNERLLQKIKYQYPDIIAVTGDMIDSSNIDFPNLFYLIEKLSLKYPVYYVLGNHELRLDEDNYNSLISQLTLCGAVILNNTSVTIKRNDDAIVISGLNNELSYYPSKRNDEKKKTFTLNAMKELLGAADTAGYNILLTHSPFDFDIYSQWGADLSLCGHVHGGMIRLPKIGGVFSPDYNYFPQYQNGLYSDGENSMIVNKGLGSAKIPLRFFNKPEITAVTLKSRQVTEF